MGNEIETREPDALDALERLDLAEFVERRIEVLNKVAAIVCKRTKPQDWTLIQGEPWLRDSGAERIMPVFGICVEFIRDDRGEPQVVREDGEDERGKFFTYTAFGRASIRGQAPWLDVVGTASSRKSIYLNRKDKDGETYERPLSEINPCDVKQDAISDLYRNACQRILGIRRLSVEDLERHGIEIKGGAFDFKGGGEKRDQGAKSGGQGAKSGPGRRGNNSAPKESPHDSGASGAISEGQGRRLFAIATKEAGWTVEAYREAIQGFGYKSDRHIPVAHYDAIVDWFKKHKPGDFPLDQGDADDQGDTDAPAPGDLF